MADKEKEDRGLPRESPLERRWGRHLRIWEWGWYDIALLFLVLAFIANFLVLLGNILAS